VAGMTAYERLSNLTLRKEDKSIVDSQIIVLSDSKDETRKKGNALSICESFKTISEDNSLIYKSCKAKVYFDEYKVKGVAINTISTEEATNFLEIPGRSMLQQHNNIEKVDLLEVEAPVELQQGYLSLGKVTYKGHEQEAFLRDEYNLGNLPLTIMGPQSSGKTTAISNYVVNAHKRKEAIIIPDFVKNCELSAAIESVIEKQDLCIIDLSNPKNIQGLGYNEIKFKSSMSDFELLELANMQSQQVMALVDAINNEGLPLTSKMRRYLSSASNVVFLNQNSNVRNVINCLQDYHKRAYYITRIPQNLKEQLEDEINSLKELNEITVSKDITQVTGTKDSKIDGISDRINNLLREDSKLKYMFNKKLDGNIDLVEEIEKGKIILIKMPGIKFPLPYVKNVLVTYFITKVCLMLQLRGAKYEKPNR